MEAIIAIVVIIVFAWIAWAIYSASKKREIVICSSCGNKMSRGNFQAKGGCPRCGSDLYQRTGKKAGD